MESFEDFRDFDTGWDFPSSWNWMNYPSRDFSEMGFSRRGPPSRNLWDLADFSNRRIGLPSSAPRYFPYRLPSSRRLPERDLDMFTHDHKDVGRVLFPNFDRGDFDVLPDPYPAGELGRWRPRTDVLEVGGAMRVEFELPGVPTSNIQLTVTPDMVVVRTLKLLTGSERKGIYIIDERHFGSYYRRVNLPHRGDVSSTAAVLEHGVLKISIPIATEQQSTVTGAGTTIPIQDSTSNATSATSSAQQKATQSS